MVSATTYSKEKFAADIAQQVGLRESSLIQQNIKVTKQRDEITMSFYFPGPNGTVNEFSFIQEKNGSKTYGVMNSEEVTFNDFGIIQNDSAYNSCLRKIKEIVMKCGLYSSHSAAPRMEIMGRFTRPEFILKPQALPHAAPQSEFQTFDKMSPEQFRNRLARSVDGAKGAAIANISPDRFQGGSNGVSSGFHWYILSEGFTKRIELKRNLDTQEIKYIESYRSDGMPINTFKEIRDQRQFDEVLRNIAERLVTPGTAIYSQQRGSIAFFVDACKPKASAPPKEEPPRARAHTEAPRARHTPPPAPRVFPKDELFKMLGLEADADDAAVRKAYRKLSLESHPDRTDDVNKIEKFKKVSGLYESLGYK
jgi:hypothetical protein